MKRKKPTIFRMFLAPLLAIMLVQSIITIGTLVIRRTGDTLERYASGMMSRLVENRRVILQNDMNQRWQSVCGQEEHLNDVLKRFLAVERSTPGTLLRSNEMKDRLLEQMFPECLNILHSSSTTGIFLILTGPDPQTAGEYSGFFIRDSDPNTSPANYTDLLLERGDKQLSRKWDIPLDTNWTTRFHMEGMGNEPADRFFYEPWKAGEAYADADAADLGYWALPFTLEKGGTDGYEMITYSIPLRYQGMVYGVLGIEISSRTLYEYFPVSELSDTQQSGYLLALRGENGSYTPLVGKGMLYDLIRSCCAVLQKTAYNNLYRVEGVDLNGEGVYAVVSPLRLYSNNVPYEDTDWVLLGLNTEQEIFGMSRKLYVWMLAAILLGLAFGVFGICVLVRHLTRPIQQLMVCISRGSAGLQEFKGSNILEIDALYDVVNGLTEQQKEAENILLEEKERYRMALESSKDIFFSYDLESKVLDLVNHKTMSGRWQCPMHGQEVVNLEYIYGPDRAAALKAMKQDADSLYAEFRIRWPEETEFRWVALSAKAVYDTDGRRRKLIGTIQDIHEQQEKKLEQLRKNQRDGVTGLYGFHAGMECLRESRRQQPDGVMANLCLDRLKETSEKNGIVFSDLILEEFGAILRQKCRAYTEQTGRPAVAVRLNEEEFALWMQGHAGKQAAETISALLGAVNSGFSAETFRVRMYTGLAHGSGAEDTEQLICRASLARSFVVPDAGTQCVCFEDIPDGGHAMLPPLQGHEVNSLGYSEEVGLVSVALNLFGKGDDFPAQMLLMTRKIGRFYRAEGVLVSMLRADFNSNYLNYQWHRNREPASDYVRKYTEEDKNAFFNWLGEEEVRYFSDEDSESPTVQRFLSIAPGQHGVLLPMYDNGQYMGNICILGVAPELLENPEEYQNLAELGRVIQGQLNQRQHDIASRAKSEFLSRMSHEIRTPMNGIIGMTAIALQQNQSPERIIDCLQKIQSSSDYLLGLINDILDMSKIESGKMKLAPSDFDMQEMLETIKELITPQAAKKRIVFTQRIELEHRWFDADRMRISQVLINLLGNAVKFTPEKGRVTLEVRELGSNGKEALVSFSVSDTGIGIAEEDQERVFRSFEQASANDPSKQQGTGLGLSISSRLVQMMGSNIQLESEPGEGSTFHFAIPLALGEGVEAEEEEEEISFEGRRVLVVEDNELNAEIAKCLLEERGFEVDCVGDGAQAVERIRTTEPGTYDVILMDIMMPVMNGLDAARAIRAMEREDCRTLPIIAMSANAFDDDLKKSVECGMNGHLSKPVEVEKLYKTLDTVVRGNAQ